MEVTKTESGGAFEGAGFGDVKPCFWISSGAPTRALYVAFAAKTRKAADDLYAAALAAGAKDNGPRRAPRITIQITTGLSLPIPTGVPFTALTVFLIGVIIIYYLVSLFT
jgi:hypothetical protein